MNETPHQENLELLPAYALGVLDAEEAARVAGHLPTCAACRHELAAYEEVAGLLPLAAPPVTPSDTLRAKLMARAAAAEARPAATTAEARPAAVTPTYRGWRPRLAEWWRVAPRWQPVALVAILVLVGANLLLWQWALRPAGRPGETIVLTGTDAAPEAWGTILVSNDGRNATLIVESLPPLEVTQQYQLWLVMGDDRASGAVFSVNADGYSSVAIDASRPVGEYTGFGVTIEPAGGSPGPTGARVLQPD
jgi:anti-sigma-K factor RskA